MADAARAEALAAYTAAMTGVALPTTDEQLLTFHNFSREDALEQLRERLAALSAPPEARAAAERELEDQIAEYVAHAEPCAQDLFSLVRTRQLRGGAFAELWRRNVESSRAAYAAVAADLRAELGSKRDAQAYRSILEYELEASRAQEKLGVDERWSATGRRLATREFEAQLNTDRAVVLELLYSQRVGKLEEQLTAAVRKIAALSDELGARRADYETTAAGLHALQQHCNKEAAEGADRHAVTLELQALHKRLAAQVQDGRQHTHNSLAAARAEALQVAERAAAAQQQTLEQVVKEQRENGEERLAALQASEAKLREMMEKRLASHASVQVSKLHDTLHAAQAGLETALKAHRETEDGRWEKSGREIDRLRLELFETAKKSTIAHESQLAVANQRVSALGEQVNRLQQDNDLGGGMGAAGVLRDERTQSPVVEARLRKQEAQLDRVEASQASQHQLLLAAIEEVAHELHAKGTTDDEASAAVLKRLSMLEALCDEQRDKQREQHEAQLAVTLEAENHRQRTQEALEALRSSERELRGLCEHQQNDNSATAATNTTDIVAAVNDSKQSIKSWCNTRFDEIKSLGRVAVQDCAELRAALAAAERGHEATRAAQADARAAHDDAIELAQAQLQAYAQSHKGALQAVEQAFEQRQRSADETVEQALEQARAVAAAQQSAVDTAMEALASEVRVLGQRNDAKVQRISSELQRARTAESQEVLSCVQDIEARAARDRRDAELAEERYQLQLDELKLALKALARGAEARWDKNGRELDRLRVEHMEALKSHAEEQEMKWRASEQNVEWLRTNVRAQTGTAFTELRALVDKQGIERQEQAARLDGMTRMLHRLQEGVLEVHHVELTGVVKTLEERMSLRWEASDARHDQMQRLLAEVKELASSSQGSEAWVESAKDTLRTTAEELREPLELERIRTREALAELRQLVVQQQDRNDSAETALSRLRESHEMVRAAHSDAMASIVQDIAASRPGPVADDIGQQYEALSRAFGDFVVKMGGNVERLDARVTGELGQREEEQRLLMAAIAQEEAHRVASETRQSESTRQLVQQATATIQAEAQVQFKGMHTWMKERADVAESFHTEVTTRFSSLEEGWNEYRDTLGTHAHKIDALQQEHSKLEASGSQQHQDIVSAVEALIKAQDSGSDDGDDTSPPVSNTQKISRELWQQG
eukprot:g3201.t1